MNLKKYFMVGETFRHMHKSTDVPQYHGEKFASFIRRNVGKQIRIDFAFMHPMHEYVSTQKMMDTEMARKTDSESLRENQFLLILYSLIIEPKLGELKFGLKIRPDIYYFFHIILDSGEKVAVDIVFDKKKYSISMDEFDNDRMFCKSFVLIYQNHRVGL